MFISEKLVYTELKELNFVEDYLECVFVKILHNGNLIVVGNVYRQPNNNAIDFNDAMINTLKNKVIILVILWLTTIWIWWNMISTLQQRNFLILCMPILLYLSLIDPQYWLWILAL